MTKKEKRPFHAVTKAEARLFANAFFGKSVELIGRDDEADKDSNGYLFKMGHITFDVYPVYGDGTDLDVLTAAVCINGLTVGYAVSDMGEIVFERFKETVIKNISKKSSNKFCISCVIGEIRINGNLYTLSIAKDFSPIFIHNKKGFCCLEWEDMLLYAERAGLFQNVPLYGGEEDD